MFRKLFQKKKTADKAETPVFDPEVYRPVLRCSICTGEQVAGFVNRSSGQFEEIMLIRNEADLEEFRQKYNVSQIEKIY